MNYRTSFFSVVILYVAIGGGVMADTFTVTNTNDTGAGSLRVAIDNANAHFGLDTIVFNIPGAGVQTITPGSPGLPQITSPVVINGYSQPGSSANTLVSGDNAAILIELSSAIISNNANGLSIAAGGSGSTIRGLVIDSGTNGPPTAGFNSGVQILSNSNIVEGCFIGVNASGTVPHANITGVLVEFGVNATSNLIGGTTPASRNLISGNATGVFIRGTNNGNTVQGNFIGTDASGSNAIPNNTGINVASNNNLIGGTIVGARNIVAGPGSSSGGPIGIAVGNGDSGGANGNQIQGNFIGTDATGANALGWTNGIVVSGVSGTVIGGPTSIAGSPPGNLISGNNGFGGGRGIQLSGGASSSVIQGNLVGLDASGTTNLGNTLEGIFINGSPSNTIGGAAANTRNVISGNGRNGVLIDGDSNLDNNLVQGNLISANGGNGVLINVGVNNAVLTNSIFGNGRLGIDLGAFAVGFDGNGVTPNDTGDPDIGANNLQNFPILTAASVGNGTITISGTLNSTASTTFRVEFFANAACDPSLHGEGKSFLGFVNVTTDPSGNVGFGPLAFALPAGQTIIAATATDPLNNTSEFSPCFVPISAVSRKTHTGAGTFDVSLPLSGTRGVECRAGSGPNLDGHQIVVMFTVPVTFTSAMVTSGTGTVASATASGTDVIINLTGVANAQNIILTLFGVNDGSGVFNLPLPMSFLLGDTNGNRAVNASDIGQIKAQSGQAITAANFRTDVNANGAINASDIGQVKAQSGTSLP